MRMSKIRATARQIQALSLAVAVSLPLLAPATVLAQSADERIEEVTVYGIRSSLDTAADIKRNSDNIVDAITAEDIGLFSDNNIEQDLDSWSRSAFRTDDPEWPHGFIQPGR